MAMTKSLVSKTSEEITSIYQIRMLRTNFTICNLLPSERQRKIISYQKEIEEKKRPKIIGK